VDDGVVGVVDDLDGLRVGAVVAVGGVRDVAAAVADTRGHDTGLVPEQLLHAPEAAAAAKLDPIDAGLVTLVDIDGTPFS
jgi:hypothetical protein